MKAISGYAEWFWLMAKNWKLVENRDWSLTRYFDRESLPVRVYLHASKTKATLKDICFIRGRLTDEQWQEFTVVDWDSLRGHIIGEVTIKDEITQDDIGIRVSYNPWFFGAYGFVVTDGQLYDRPIPYKGQLGFFEANPFYDERELHECYR